MQVRTRTWFGFIVLASLLFLAGSRFALFEPLENAVLSVASPVELAMRNATRPAADFINNLTDINRLSDENQALRDENGRLLAENALLAEAARDLQQLQGLLALRGTREGETFVEGHVFAHEPNNLLDRIAIDRGSADGLQEDMVVLTQQGTMVGTISRVLERTAWVTLITDQTSAVGAFLQESRAQGVVVGAADGTLTMEFVEETADVKEGDLVLTSGVSGSHPPNELIGRVIEVDRSAQELFQEVRVEPLADLNQLETVLVLSSFVPLDPGAP